MRIRAARRNTRKDKKEAMFRVRVGVHKTMSNVFIYSSREGSM